jgi:hypothetical protein
MEIVWAQTNLGNHLLFNKILEDLRIAQVLNTGKRIKTFKDYPLKILRMKVCLQDLKANFKIKTKNYQSVKIIYQIILNRSIRYNKHKTL